MRIKASAGAIRAAMARVLPAVERRNTIPILSNVLISTADDGRVIFTATNMDLEISVRAEADIADIGAVTVPAAVLARFITFAQPDEMVSISRSEEGVEVTGRDGSITLRDLPAADWPETRLGAEEAVAEVQAGALAKALRTVNYAIGREETRFYINGVHLCRKDGALTLETTDGHRMVKYRMEGAGGQAFAASTIMPRQPAQLLAAAATGAPQDAQIVIRQHATGVAVTLPGDAVMRARHIDATFPDVDRVIPAETGPAATIDRARLLRALDIAASVASGDKNRAAVALEFDGTRLMASCTDPENGKANAPCPMAYTGKTVTIGVNQRYLRDFLRTATGKTVSCVVVDHCSPMKWTDDATPEALALLMPMRL